MIRDKNSNLIIIVNNSKATPQAVLGHDHKPLNSYMHQASGFTNFSAGAKNLSLV